MRSGSAIAGYLLAFAIGAECTDNGMAPTPPMGWRSWNAFHLDINDKVIRDIVDAVASRSRLVDGKPTSLADLGFGRVGIDDGWQACGTGWQGTFHAKDGTPLVNKTTFPDLKALVNYGHSKGVKMGWYSINCHCMDTYTIQRNDDKDWAARVYAAEVKLVQDAGFDGVKIDNCGDDQASGFVMMVQNINKSGSPLLIENSDQGNSGNARGLPTDPSKECPGNFFRSGGDIGPDYGGVIDKLQRTTPFQDVNNPIARPDCWAYPDMLEVGNFPVKNDYIQSRSHFGAWAIVSSPLVLGYDLRDGKTTDAIWEIISNKEAIAVNQAWHGHPGRLLHDGGSYQVWTKKLARGEHAVLVLNRQSGKVKNVAVSLGDLDLKGTCAVRDIWARKDLQSAQGTWHSGPLEAYDSVFIRLSPSGPQPGPSPSPPPAPPAPSANGVWIYEKGGAGKTFLTESKFQVNSHSGRGGAAAWDACGGASFDNGHPVWSSGQGSNVDSFEVKGTWSVRLATQCGATYDYPNMAVIGQFSASDGNRDAQGLVYLEAASAASVVI